LQIETLLIRSAPAPVAWAGGGAGCVFSLHPAPACGLPGGSAAWRWCEA